MTAKDYQLIAYTIKQANAKYIEQLDKWHEYDSGAFGFVIDQFCEDLAAQNPRFDPVRFRKACA